MSRQMFFHELFTPKPDVSEEQLSELRILNWNIRNPSIARAKEQADWIVSTNANVIILTEAKYSDGGLYIRDWLESFGFKVVFPKPEFDDYCVMVASKSHNSEIVEPKIKFLRHRIVMIACETSFGEIKIAGVYVPSRGPIERRNEAKMKFQDQISELLHHLSNTGGTSDLVIGGDLNVVEPDHKPHYSVFGDWEYRFYNSFVASGLIDTYRLLHNNTQEYSWFGREGDGYRFDHLFISNELSSHIIECSYIHAPRISKLSDHSAMCLKLIDNPAGA